MAEHVMKKYLAKVEKTVYVVEELEILAETEKEAEELLDDWCCGEHDEHVTVIHTEEQEVQTLLRQSFTDGNTQGSE